MRLFKTRYVAELEKQIAEKDAEIVRLRRRDAALVDSFLLRGGYSPVTQPEEFKPVKPVVRESWFAYANRKAREAVANARADTEAEQ